MDKLRLETLLGKISFATRVEITDMQLNTLKEGRVYEIIAEHDFDLLNREVEQINPDHTARENYIEITVL